ncbi:MAG: hypothetical protein GX335_00060 [Firmicutes bacterium]|nr:hypothetical protein [Bacillota bacterium]
MEMEEMDLREYWEIILKRRGLIFLVFLATVLAVTVYSFLATPVYEATSTLMVHEQGGAAQMMLFDSLGGMAKNAAQNYVQIMKSRNILEKTRAELGLEQSIKKLKQALTIHPIQGTDILEVSMQSTDPEEAMLFVNQLTEVFIDWNRLTKQEEHRSARLFIESQLATVSENLRQAEERLRHFKETEKTLSPSQETVAGIEELATLESGLSQVSINKMETEERIAQVRSKLEEQEETLISSTTISENRFVTEYRARLADLEIALSGAKEKYTERHPSVLALQAEIEDVKAKLAEQVERVIGTETRSLNPIHGELYGSLIRLEVDFMALLARQEALESLIRASEAKLGRLPTKELELARLMRDAKVLEELFIMLRTRNEETRIAEAVQTADVQVIDNAILPTIPVKPRIKLNIAIGAVLGVFLGVGLGFLLEFTDNTLKTKEEVESFLGVPVLGQIPVFNSEDKSGRKRGVFGWGKAVER